MADGSLANVLRRVRAMGAAHGAAPPADRELLDRFAAGRDDAAFAALVERHGPMVLGVCRRILRDAHDAEDACQAAFLVLARKAGSVRERDALAGWLHGVACRVARRLRADIARRGARPSRAVPAPGPDAAAEATWREVRAVLDEELARLPGPYRAALALCYLEGRTQDEAARQLGWTLGALRGRLERGRERLRARLARRGLSLGAAFSAAALTEARAVVPPVLAASTVKAAGIVAAGDVAAAAGVVPARAAALAEGVLRAMTIGQLKACALALVVALGAVSLAYHRASAGPADPPPPPGSPAADEKRPKERVLTGLEKKLVGTWVGTRGFIVPTLAIAADGTFRETVVDVTSEGTWALEADALPPTLVRRYAKSNDSQLAGATIRVKVVGLDDKQLALEKANNTDPWWGQRPTTYARAKEAPPAGGAGRPGGENPRRADVAGEWRSDHGLAGVFFTLDLKDDGTFTLGHREVAPKLDLVTTGTWALDGDRVALREERQVRDGKPVPWGGGVFFPVGRADALTAARTDDGWVLSRGKDLKFERPPAPRPKGGGPQK